eukprot:767748-Hanusia_phi.AAC.2
MPDEDSARQSYTEKESEMIADQWLEYSSLCRATVRKQECTDIRVCCAAFSSTTCPHQRQQQ